MFNLRAGFLPKSNIVGFYHPSGVSIVSTQLNPTLPAPTGVPWDFGDCQPGRIGSAGVVVAQDSRFVVVTAALEQSVGPPLTAPKKPRSRDLLSTNQCSHAENLGSVCLSYDEVITSDGNVSKIKRLK